MTRSASGGVSWQSHSVGTTSGPAGTGGFVASKAVGAAAFAPSEGGAGIASSAPMQCAAFGPGEGGDNQGLGDSYDPDSTAGVGSPGGASAGRRRPIPPKLYRIGEVVDYSGVSRQTVHNYTTMGLLRESRWTAGGHRLYDESVFPRLDEIAELKARRKSMRDIREHFARIDSKSA